MKKESASFPVSNHLKSRKGRRSIRVDTLLKKDRALNEKRGSESGADLRVPLMGGTKFPTQDSTAFSRKLLNSSQKVSAFSKPRGTKLEDVVPKIEVPGLKESADMTIKNDPLVAHLRKQAEVLECNIDELPRGPEVQSLTKEDPGDDIGPAEAQLKRYINELFDHGEDVRSKDTSHNYEEGVVDRILKL